MGGAPPPREGCRSLPAPPGTTSLGAPPPALTGEPRALVAPACAGRSVCSGARGARPDSVVVVAGPARPDPRGDWVRLCAGEGAAEEGRERAEERRAERAAAREDEEETEGALALALGGGSVDWAESERGGERVLE